MDQLTSDPKYKGFNFSIIADSNIIVGNSNTIINRATGVSVDKDVVIRIGGRDRQQVLGRELAELGDKKFTNLLRGIMHPLATRTVSRVSFRTNLYQLHVLTQDDLDRLKLVGSKFEQNVEIYRIVSQKNRPKELIQALTASGNEHIIQLIEETLIQSKMDSVDDGQFVFQQSENDPMSVPPPESQTQTTKFISHEPALGSSNGDQVPAAERAIQIMENAAGNNQHQGLEDTRVPWLLAFCKNHLEPRWFLIFLLVIFLFFLASYHRA